MALSLESLSAIAQHAPAIIAASRPHRLLQFRAAKGMFIPSGEIELERKTL